MATNGGTPKGPRCIALVGPFQGGKTTLLEAILAAPAQFRARVRSKPATPSATPARKRAITR